MRLPGGVPGPRPGAARLRQVEEGRSGRGSGSGSRGGRRKGKSRDSFRLTGVDPLRRGALSRFPASAPIRTHESRASSRRKIEDGTARILSATVSAGPLSGGSCRSPSKSSGTCPGAHARPGTAVGIDLGVKTLLTGVDDRGRVIEVAGPKPLRSALRKLRRASRAHSRKQPGRRAGARAPRGSPASTPASPTSARDALHKATTALASPVRDGRRRGPERHRA